MARQERTFKTDAIILRRHEFREYDWLLTLLTPAEGKIRVIAKGARRLNARNMGHVELFSLARMLVGRGRDLHIVQQSEQMNAYVMLRENLSRGAYANYVVELVDHLIEQDEENQEVFDLLRDTLNRLCVSDYDPALVAHYFEIELLRIIGFQPQVFNCAYGGEPIQPTPQYFSIESGGIVCPDHAMHTRANVAIGLDTVKLLRHLHRTDWPDLAHLRIKSDVNIEIDRALNAYLLGILENKIKSVDFLKRVRE